MPSQSPPVTVNVSHQIDFQITLAALYLGPAVILHFVINWIWGDEKPKSTDE